MRALLSAAMLVFSACTMTPPAPGPVTPPPAPQPTPAGTDCERAAANYVQHHCGAATSAQYVAACEGYEQLGGASSWNPQCQADAREPDVCAAIESCRAGQ